MYDTTNSISREKIHFVDMHGLSMQVLHNSKCKKSKFNYFAESNNVHSCAQLMQQETFTAVKHICVIYFVRLSEVILLFDGQQQRYCDLTFGPTL